MDKDKIERYLAIKKEIEKYEYLLDCERYYGRMVIRTESSPIYWEIPEICEYRIRETLREQLKRLKAEMEEHSETNVTATRDDIYRRVVDVIGNLSYHYECNNLTCSDDTLGALGFDSLSVLDVGMEIQKEFGIHDSLDITKESTPIQIADEVWAVLNDTSC